MKISAVTVSVAVAPPAVTVSVNTRVVSSCRTGATKLGVAVVASVNVTVGSPSVWAHE